MRLLLAIVLLAPAPALAQPGPSVDEGARATARELGYQGVAAIERGDAALALGEVDKAEACYALASEKLEKAYAIVHVHTLGLYSARAMVKRGLLVKAGERYFEVARMPLGLGDAREQEKARSAALDERATLMPRIPALRIVVQGPSPRDVKVTLDGAPVDAALLGVSFGVDPGRHDLEVRGAAVVQRRIKIGEGEAQTLTFQLPATPSPREGAGPGAAPVWSDSLARARTQRLGGAIGLGAAGVVSLGFAGAAFGVAANRWSRAQAACGPNPMACQSSEGQSLSKDARTWAQVTNVALGVGGSALAGAAVLWAAAPSKPAGVWVKVGVAPSGVAVSVGF